MKKQLVELVSGIPFGTTANPLKHQPKRISFGPSNQCHKVSSRASERLKHKKKNKLDRMTKVAETLTRKLSFGAKILRVGGVEKIFRYNFNVTEGEKLLKVFQCYLSTTAGPIAGLLFLSTYKVAFSSERSIELSSQNGDLVRLPYKVSIHVEKILEVNEGQDVKRASRKYIEIVTVDNFEFWFMGFLNCRRTLKYIQQTFILDSVT